MLRLIDSEERPPEIAYRVPWLVDRGRAPRYRLINAGSEPLAGIRLTMHGSGRLIWPAMGALEPGDAIEFALAGPELELDTTITVRWFRPDETEYLWRISF